MSVFLGAVSYIVTDGAIQPERDKLFGSIGRNIRKVVDMMTRYVY